MNSKDNFVLALLYLKRTAPGIYRSAKTEFSEYGDLFKALDEYDFGESQVSLQGLNAQLVANSDTPSLWDRMYDLIDKSAAHYMDKKRLSLEMKSFKDSPFPVPEKMESQGVKSMNKMLIPALVVAGVFLLARK